MIGKAAPVGGNLLIVGRCLNVGGVPLLKVPGLLGVPGLLNVLKVGVTGLEVGVAGLDVWRARDVGVSGLVLGMSGFIGIVVIVVVVVVVLVTGTDGPWKGLGRRATENTTHYQLRLGWRKKFKELASLMVQTKEQSRSCSTTFPWILRG